MVNKYLIINADDLGFSTLVNRGIRKAHSFGTVISASLMANMPAFKHAVRWARHTPSLGVGLHFNLTEGYAVAPSRVIPSLVERDGRFSGMRESWKEKEIKTELKYQYKKLIAAGIVPTHLDSHHHIHLVVPQVYTVMKSFAQRRHIPMRLHPESNDPLSRPLRTDHLILETYETDDGITRLVQHMQHLQEGTTEIMCHPRYRSKSERAESHTQDKRDGELRAFTNPLLLRSIQEHHIRLIHFGHLAEL